MRIGSLFASLFLLLATSIASAAAPNVLFVLIDDMGYGDLTCYGEKRVHTTHIDRLAAEGIRFTQFYVNAPICSPSRSAGARRPVINPDKLKLPFQRLRIARRIQALHQRDPDAEKSWALALIRSTEKAKVSRDVGCASVGGKRSQQGARGHLENAWS